MPLATGTRLGPYEITSPLGAGGMGEVYRARDARLGREVAIKVLPPEVARDADRRARFEREARAVAALSHPNILALFDIGTDGDLLFVVTELLDGDTLAERLQQGALPVRKAVEIAVAIARGLAATHGKGIAHRDLKPANVFLLADGQVKILDFGLAREVAHASSGATATQAALTDPGTVLGTAGYMAPEQIRGQPVDGRADLFALGVVLYEMLTGQRAFARETTAETLTAILKDDPPELTTTRADLPPALDRIVRHCLEKSPTERFQTARDVVFALDGLSGSASSLSMAVASASRLRLSWAASLVVALACSVAATALVTLWSIRAGSQPAIPILVAVPPPADGFGSQPHPAISPDGLRVAYWAADTNGRVRLWIHELSDGSRRAVSGEHARGVDAGPIDFSPDGRTLYFSLDARLKRVQLAGGDAEKWNDESAFFGLTEAADGAILASGSYRGPLRWIRPGAAEVDHVDIRDADGASLFPLYPHFLPDSRHFLFLSAHRHSIYVGEVGQASARLLIDADSPAKYSNGHILYVRDRILMAQRFDPSSLEMEGDPQRLASGVGTDPTYFSAWSFSTSDNGHVLFWDSLAVPTSQLEWFDRGGRRLGPVGPAGKYLGLSYAAEASRVALEAMIVDGGVRVEARIADLGRDAAQVRVALDGIAPYTGTPWLSKDAKRLWAVAWPGLFSVPLDGRPAARIADVTAWFEDESPDGRLVAYSTNTNTPSGSTDIWTLAADGATPPRPFRTTQFSEYSLRISPDGRWAAWVGGDSGALDVYVTSFPEPGLVTRVSPSGGTQPMWRQDGLELFFLTAANELWAAGVSAGAREIRVTQPRRLFAAPTVLDFERRQYAPSSDGQRFLFNARSEGEAGGTANLLLNWPALLK